MTDTQARALDLLHARRRLAREWAAYARTMTPARTPARLRRPSQWRLRAG